MMKLYNTFPCYKGDWGLLSLVETYSQDNRIKLMSAFCTVILLYPFSQNNILKCLVVGLFKNVRRP